MCLRTLLTDQQSENHKYAILLKHVKVPRAYNLVLAYAQSSTPYTSALTALDDRYGRPWDYALHELRAIEQLPAVKDDRALDDLAVRIQALVGMLTTHGTAGLVEIHSSSNVERILQKISRERRERFRRKQNNLRPGNEMNNLNDLAEFLKEEVRNIRLDHTTQAERGDGDSWSGDCAQEKGKKTRHSWNRGRTAKVMLNTDEAKRENNSPEAAKQGPSSQRKQKRTPPPCPYCNEAHWLPQCESFARMNTDSRVKWMRDNKRCWRCAREHQAKDCTLKRPCDSCPRTHLTILHEVNNKLHGESKDEETPPQVKCYYLDPGSSANVLLKVAKVHLHSEGRVFETYAVLDDGSERTFLLPEAAHQLGLQGMEEKLAIRTIQRDVKDIIGARVSFEIAPARRPHKKYPMSDVFTGGQIALSQYDYPLESLRERYPHLRQLDIDPIQGAKPTLLIGSDHADLILPISPVLRGPRGCPAAIETILGWTLQGITDRKNRKERPVQCFHSSVDSQEPTLLDNVKKLWQLDALPHRSEKDYTRSKEDEYALNLLREKTVRVDINGVKRYATPLLRRQLMPVFHVSPNVVAPLLRSTEERMRKNEELAISYRKEMDQLMDTRLVRKLAPAEADLSAESWYLPHHNVRHNGKNRVVFNCSFQVRQLNLNRHLLPGPTLTPSLIGVLVRFRRYRTAVSGDIRRMFHQVRLLAEDRPLLRFLWRERSEDLEPSIYEWEVLPFGTTCSPCCATYALQTHASLETAPPGVKDSVLKAFYVDNCLQSLRRPEEAVELVKNLRSFLAIGGFDVCQWASNDPRVISGLPNDARSVSSETWVSQTEHGAQEMTLGLLWRFKDDTLCYKHKPVTHKVTTMRAIYSTLASQYDPLGYIIPYTTRAKVLVRELWATERGWDDPLPAGLGGRWKEWEEELPTLERVKLPRSYLPRAVDPMTCQLDLHVFCDASELAYGAVAYLRAHEPKGAVHVSFLLARSRVAPKKQQSIPRLELCAALLGAQLAEMLTKELNLPLHGTTMWSDSTTVITWLRSGSCRYKVFVGTRVAEIQLLMKEADIWRYVDTGRNPADIITRGTTLEDLSRPNPYHQGPEFLRQSESEWPTIPTKVEVHEDVEIKKSPFCGLVQLPRMEGPPMDDCDSLEDLQHLTFCHENKLPTTTQLSADNYAEAERLVLLRAQRESFSEELECLRRGNPVSLDSKLRDLAPELDGDLIRVGGRLRRAQDLAEDTKHPILLPSEHQVTKLVIQHYDAKMCHAGAERVFAEIRRRFWILQGREAVRRFQRTCIGCRTWRGRPVIPVIADLPGSRLELRKAPFHSTGVDCFGPFAIRRGRANEKRWGIVFKCMTTRAVHIEVLHHMTTDSFLMSFRRFVSRRGTPYALLSDQGTNFKGGESELRDSFDSLKPDIQGLLVKNQVRFVFNPPNAPHMGGTWEREVRSIKTALYTVLGQQTPTDEVFATVLVEIEGILNSKPLGYASSDVADVDPITPNCLLMGRRDPTLPQAVYDPSELVGRRLWRHSQVLTDQFWRKFVLLYLPSLQTRRKWTKETNNLAQGSVVMIVDQSLPRAMWLTGRVKEVLPGTDGRVRAAVVDVGGRTYTRPEARLIELPHLPDTDPTDPDPD